MKRYFYTSMIAGFLFLAMVFITPAYAADENPCAEDIAKFCKAAKSDRSAIMACLEAHESELSDSCRHHEAKMEGRRAEAGELARIKMRFLQDCRADIAALCKDVDPHKGGYLPCITSREKELSTQCTDWLKAYRAEEKKKQ